MEIEIPDWAEELRTPARYKVFWGGRGGAKCLAIGTRVIMFDGSLRAVEDVKTGDKLMGIDNLPRLVLGTTRGTDKMYRIKQTSAMDYVVNSAHILSLKKRKPSKSDYRIQKSGNPRNPNGRYSSWPEITNISVIDWLKQSKRWKESFRGYRSGLIQFSSQEVLIDPYFLGLWLGDGDSDRIAITSADKEICEYWIEYGKSCGMGHYYDKKKSKADHIRLNRFLDKNNSLFLAFEKFNLIKNKHIPLEYIVNSEEVRLSLLAGLIDTDGYLHNNTYSIAQVRESLAKDIKYLADTLGFRTRIVRKKTVCSNNGTKGFAYYVSICGDIWRIPCLLPRKSLKKEDLSKNKDWLLSQISIEPVGEGEYAGFELDGDHLFLLEDGTVLHNSHSVAKCLLLMGAEKKIRILCLREFQSSMRDSVHKLLCDQIELMGLQDFYEMQQSIIIGRNGTEVTFEGLRHNANKIRSQEGVDIVWVEEAQTVSKMSWDVLIPTIRKDNSEIWMTFNPELDTDETYKRFVINPPKGAIVRKINWDQNPWFPEVLKAEKDHLKNTDYDAYLNVWEGHCKQALEGAIYARELREAQFAGRITRVPYSAAKPVDVFFDLGWSDNTSLWFVQRIGFELRVIRSYQNRHQALHHYLQYIQSQQYIIGTIWLPHDARAKQLGTGLSIEEMAKASGYAVKIVPMLSVEDGINALRTVFPMMYFDEEGCADGIQALRRYRYKVDQLTGQTSREPLHDDASHYADSARYIAVALHEPKKSQSRLVIDAKKYVHTDQSTSWMS